MKSKSLDVEYCGVCSDRVREACPVLNERNLGYLKRWIRERYGIRLRKDVFCLDAPWTDDDVLANYRFCNVRREHDRESRWLIRNVCCGDVSFENKLLNCILFRLINKSETFEIFGVLDFDDLDLDLIAERLRDFGSGNPDYVYFSGAFFTSGPKVVCNRIFGRGGDMIVKMIRLVERFYCDGILDGILGAGSQEEVYLALRQFPGLGKFLAYQIFVDFSYIEDFAFSENEFVVAGPGCEKGLDLVFDDFGGLSYEEALFWLRDNQEDVFGDDFGELFCDLDEFDRRMNVMSLQNCMCEVSKYIRAIEGVGRPRVRYVIED